MNKILKVALRQQAVYIPANAMNGAAGMNPDTTLLVANMAKLGFGVSERLLRALEKTDAATHTQLLEHLRKVLGTDLNWAPLVKNWSVPTGESYADHLITYFTNLLGLTGGTRLACGCLIPPHTFPLERYNGCPFCGTPLEAAAIEHYGQNKKLRVLDLWTLEDAEQYLENLLASRTALDATQQSSLRRLLTELPVPEGKIAMRETAITVIDILVQQGRAEKAQALFNTPTDILRYLWFKHTGFLQLVAPKTIIARTQRNAIGPRAGNKDLSGKTAAAASLKLKYRREDALMAARWINGLSMDAAKVCADMHPKRQMWVRFIRALRLPEYSKRTGFEHLRTILDKFYREDYDVWQGRLDQFRLRYDAASTFYLLQQRPGLFARSLFANMLWFGPEVTIEAFSAIADQVPARLLFTLQMYAEYYFDPASIRVVRPLGGTAKSLSANKLLALYTAEELEQMQLAVAGLCLEVTRKRFAAIPAAGRTMYIDPALYKIPLAIGDRSEQVQDLPAALMGTRFPLQGNTIRLFMQWGKGLPAQHLDMDLSCQISYEASTDYCSYSRLVTTGCKHSGDIRAIPNQIGTAEYINLDVEQLAAAGARYVTFTCNAFSSGSLVPEMVVGWMDSRHSMKISNKTGVAYDPSCVQHQVRITRGLAKGLVFGVLDVAARNIIWLEMPYEGQVVQQLNGNNVAGLLKKLEQKLTIGQLLEMKAAAQQLQLADTAGADEVYTAQWAMDTAAVTRLFVD
ncbi:hypothetical protein SAMN04488128_1011609 [Chitinophaga eiseniae]|uniref:Uncharacterized protein n=1 Tax=Chitinophaga eiseniae TaxID=634771 RepID=A0A1T4NJ93_9BACT|nr:hypothetical protein [Chitinophaga eiseniae]SJZ79107.1 hypothetical protein SAMN04488128_1011609 [Chitinophaga eiseniae]